MSACKHRTVKGGRFCAFCGEEIITPKDLARDKYRKMADDKLLSEVFGLAEEALGACDGREEPLYSNAEREVLEAMLDVAHDRFVKSSELKAFTVPKGPKSR